MTALDSAGLDGVQLVQATLPPFYYDTVSDRPTCVGAGDAISALRRAETGGAGLTVLRDHRPGRTPVTAVATTDPAPLDGVDAFVTACSDYSITAGASGPAQVRVREEPVDVAGCRLLTEIRSPQPSGTPLITRTLVARVAGAGLLVVLGPAPGIAPSRISAIRLDELGACAPPG